mgnify:CR=1 FL=1
MASLSLGTNYSLGDHMKKYLYGTTALAAVGLAAGSVQAAEPLHYELGGYYNQIFGYADSDGTLTADSDEAVVYNNAEVYFKMNGELDNGLKIGGRIELEGGQQGDQIDQAYLILAGGFGQLRIGAINSGGYSYGWNTSAPAVGVGINSGWTSNFVANAGVGVTVGGAFRSPANSTVLDASNDDQKLTYFTPRMNGFQLTTSWSPLASSTGGENSGLVTESTTYTNAWDLGLSYSGGWDDVSVEVTAVIAGANAPSAVEAAGYDDYLAFTGGVGVGVGGISVAANFAKVAEGHAQAGNTQSSEGTAFNIGAGYSTGPFGFSITYFHGQEEGIVANAGDVENEYFAVAASYTLGPGLRTHITFLSIDREDDTAGSAGDTDGVAVAIGINAGF